MPTAGFYAIENRKIRFGKDGQWYADDQRIENRKIALLFSRSVRAKPEGGFMLEMGEERADIEVDDTPFVIERIEGDPKSGVSVALNDQSVEPLDLTTLRRGPDHALYCGVKGGEFEARFLRSAYYHLARWIAAEKRGFVIRAGEHSYPIRDR